MDFWQNPRILRQLPWVTLVLGLAVTALLTGVVVRSIRTDEARRFDAVVVGLEGQIKRSLEEYSRILFQGRWYFANQEIRPDNFRYFFSTLDIENSYAGVQGIGYAPRIDEKDRLAHEKAARRNGVPTYRIYPAGQREEYYPVFLMEPLTARNSRALGYDMLSGHEVRGEALRRAKLSSNLTMSGRVPVVQDAGQDAQPGFVIYLPIFEEKKVSQNTSFVVKGYLFLSMRARDFIRAITEESRGKHYTDFSIYDGEHEDPNRLMYASEPTLNSITSTRRIKVTRHIEFGGRTWTLVFQSKNLGVMTSDRWAPVAAAGVGILLSILISITMLLCHRHQERERKLKENLKEKLAQFERQMQRRSKELLRQVQYLERVLDLVDCAVVSCDTFGRVIYLNKLAREIHGLPATPVPPEKWAEHYDLFELDMKTPQPFAKNPLFRALKGESVKGEKLVIHPKGGSPMIVTNHSEALYGDKGELLGAMAIIRRVDSQP